MKDNPKLIRQAAHLIEHLVIRIKSKINKEKKHNLSIGKFCAD